MNKDPEGCVEIFDNKNIFQKTRLVYLVSKKKLIHYLL